MFGFSLISIRARGARTQIYAVEAGCHQDGSQQPINFKAGMQQPVVSPASPPHSIAIRVATRIAPERAFVVVNKTDDYGRPSV